MYTCPEGFYFETTSRACLKAIEPGCIYKARLTQQTAAHCLFNQSFFVDSLGKSTDEERAKLTISYKAKLEEMKNDMISSMVTAVSCFKLTEKKCKKIE